MLIRRRSILAALFIAGITVVWAAPGAAGDDGASGASSESLPLQEQRPILPNEAAGAVPGELIVGFAPSESSTARSAAIARSGAALARHLRLPGYSLVRVPPGQEEEFAQRLLAAPGVETVDPNLVRQAFFTPNDPGYPLQWHFPVIGMPAAWDKTAGAGVTVAVIDSGVAYEDCPAATCGVDYFKAPDFAGTSFVAPWDFIGDDAHANDENGHGTHVASTIAEATNNATGVAGIAFNASIMPLKVLDADGYGDVADGIDAIVYAANNGADVVNLSLGGVGSIPAEENAVDYAVAHGVVVVAAAGNGGDDSIGDAVLDCPACYPATISVGATDINQARSYYSNYGTGTGGHTLDLVAPGGDVTVDKNGDSYADGVLQQTFEHFCVASPLDFSAFTYCFAQGTSMATPHVVGVAALVLSLDPGLTPEQVRGVLTSTATDLGTAGYDLAYGYGELNAAAAVALAQEDTDLDGCSDARELGPMSSASHGGGRDPNYFWDYGDMPDPNAMPQRDRMVRIGDLVEVLFRYGEDGDPGIDPLSTPPKTGYHTAYDRGDWVGPNPWNMEPPNGTIRVPDIVFVLMQYGHDCVGP